jgi:hypothetical protein
MGLNGTIDIRTMIALPKLKSRVIAILADEKLNRFLCRHQPKVQLALRDFAEFGTYPYMCSLRFIIGEYSPKKGEDYLPSQVNKLAEMIDALRSREDFLRASAVSA